MIKYNSQLRCWTFGSATWSGFALYWGEYYPNNVWSIRLKKRGNIVLGKLKIIW